MFVEKIPSSCLAFGENASIWSQSIQSKSFFVAIKTTRSRFQTDIVGTETNRCMPVESKREMFTECCITQVISKFSLAASDNHRRFLTVSFIFPKSVHSYNIEYTTFLNLNEKTMCINGKYLFIWLFVLPRFALFRWKDLQNRIEPLD